MAAATCFPQDWAKKMFDHTSHDFGVVARGAKVEHRFTFENIYEEDAHVAAVRSTCGCTAPKIAKKTLKTREKSEVLAVIDTRGYYGQKSATIIVTFDKPFAAEVRLQIHTNIRSDVVVQPGWVQLGTVAQGTPAEKKLIVTYAGRRGWEIVKVESPNPHLTARAIRQASGSAREARYELVVQLDKDAPAGPIQEHLLLVTNDRDSRISRVPIAVDGRVVSSATATVTPSPLVLGVVATEASVSRRLVVKGSRPFSIVSATCTDTRFTCTLPEGEKKVHLVPVEFTACEEAGKFSDTIRIVTSLDEDKPIEVPVHVSVLPNDVPRN